MKKGYALVTANAWGQCTDDGFGFSAMVDDIYLDYNKAVEARDAMIENDKEKYVEEHNGGDEYDDGLDIYEGEEDEEKYVQFILYGELQYETKYYIKPVYIRD